jgi:IS1 family transposase
VNRIKKEKQEMVLNLLSEGCAINSVVRLTGVSKNAILRLLKRVGKNCEIYMDYTMRDLSCQAIECDELHTYVFKREINLKPYEKGFIWGDWYIFVALDRETKLVPAYLIGKRDGLSALQFMRLLRRRVTNTFQLTTDKFVGYRSSVEAVFGDRIHYAQLQKLYYGDGSGREGYSPANLKGVRISKIIGKPDRSKISTSFVERNNLTIRMQLRRFARLTNAASKKMENLKAALAIHFYWYNFIRVHQTLGTTPAVKAGVTTQTWTWEPVLC